MAFKIVVVVTTTVPPLARVVPFTQVPLPFPWGTISGLVLAQIVAPEVAEVMEIVTGAGCLPEVTANVGTPAATITGMVYSPDTMPLSVNPAYVAITLMLVVAVMETEAVPENELPLIIAPAPLVVGLVLSRV